MNINENTSGGLVLPGMHRGRPRTTAADQINRLPFLSKLPKSFRGNFVAMCGEFAGTFLFLFFAFSGTQVANTQVQDPSPTKIEPSSDPAQLLYISLCFGFSLAINAWVFFRISGGLFNPAVTVGMCLVGALPYVRGVLLIIAQLLGGIASAAVVSALFPTSLKVRTTLGAGTTVVQGLFIEMFLTAELVFTIFMLAAEKHKATFIAPIGIGLSLFIAELTGNMTILPFLSPLQLTQSGSNIIYTNRRFLYRWFPQSCAVLRARGCSTRVCKLSLGQYISWPHFLNILDLSH